MTAPKYDLDELTRRYTAFNSFAEFADKNYCPTLNPVGRNAKLIKALADAFDAYQEKNDRPYRVWRGKHTKDWPSIAEKCEE
jgi:hypothetical protein